MLSWKERLLKENTNNKYWSLSEEGKETKSDYTRSKCKIIKERVSLMSVKEM